MPLVTTVRVPARLAIATLRRPATTMPMGSGRIARQGERVHVRAAPRRAADDE